MALQKQIKKPNNFSDRDLMRCIIGSMIKRGNKQKSLRFFDYLIYSIRLTYGVDGLKFLKVLLENVRPKVFLSSKKIAGIVHKIPTPISSRKSYSMAVHWFIFAATKRSASIGFARALFEEVNDLYKNPNNATLKKRDEFHKLAYINKPFLRYYKFLS